MAWQGLVGRCHLINHDNLIDENVGEIMAIMGPSGSG